MAGRVTQVGHGSRDHGGALVARRAIVQHGDCVELLARLPACSIDALVTDPPYELAMMGRRWDASGIAYDVELWKAVLRVLKPGAHGVVFGGDRTHHRVWCALEDAGFEIRASGAWVTANRFPKNKDAGRALDARLGAKRETAPVTPEAQRWDGWGTALKTIEHWALVRKPLDGTLAANLIRWGTGFLNIEACRIPLVEGDDIFEKNPPHKKPGGGFGYGNATEPVLRSPPRPRWPSMLICSDLDLDDMEPATGVAIYGEGGSSGSVARTLARGGIGYESTAEGDEAVIQGDADAFVTGVLGPYTKHFRIGAHHGVAVPDEELARILPTLVVCPPASTGEREMGCDDLPRTWVDPTRKDNAAGRNNPRAGAGRKAKRRNTHVSVKPIVLMRHIVRLVTPPGGTVLDTFTGSGSTGIASAWEGFRFLGMELNDTDDLPYVRIARARIEAAEAMPPPDITYRPAKKPEEDPRQLVLVGEGSKA